MDSGSFAAAARLLALGGVHIGVTGTPDAEELPGKYLGVMGVPRLRADDSCGDDAVPNGGLVDRRGGVQKPGAFTGDSRGGTRGREGEAKDLVPDLASGVLRGLLEVAREFRVGVGVFATRVLKATSLWHHG